jgi:uncharacterized protein
MFGLKFLGSKKAVPALVTSGRFELEREGHVAYLEYTVAGNVLGLLHSEVPEALRGSGIAATLAKTALDWAEEHHMKVDVVCPFVADFLQRHPEYSHLLLR